MAVSPSSASRSIPLSVFSSIEDVAPALRKAAKGLSLDIIEDEALGGSYGGTVNFDPSKLSLSTKERLAKVEVLVTEPFVLAQLLREDPLCLPNLRWCQSTYAGVDPLFDTDGLLDASSLYFTLTRFAGKFGPPIAEWCLARIISHERNFALTANDKKNHAWAGSRQVTRYRYLRDMTVSILGGAGDIGLCIGRAAQAFGMRVIAFGKTPLHDASESLPAGMNHYTTDLASALKEADYIVSVLPSTPQTRGLLSGDTLAQAAGAVFLNVGRGDVLDEESLILALDKGYVSAAILDVFPTEPLPKASPLWRRNDVIVSPHVSGVTRAEDVPSVVLENYRRYVEGEKLLYQVDWSKGY